MKTITKLNSIIALAISACNVFSQAPNISYPPGPFTFSVGTTITPLTVSNSGGTISINGQTTTIAGSGSAGYVNGNGTSASFNQPLGAVVDASGNIYVTDVGNQRIRKIDPSGNVTTFAGSGTPGSADGTTTAASFYHPVGMCIDASGNIYVADEDNNMIRKMTPAGVVTTIAGQTGAGYADGASSAAKFNLPCGVAIDAADNLYVADNNNNVIRKITPTGTVSTFAGNGIAAYADGQGTAASFNQPFSVTIDAAGNLYVADRYNHKIRKITPGGYVSTLAGSTMGFADGTGTAAMFNYPTTVAVDNLGNVYVADYHNNRIRKVTSAGVVTTLSGAGTAGSDNGVGSAATFNYPFAVTLDASSNIIVCDLNTNLIRKVVSTPFTIGSSLPAGLSFNTATGAISGTPTTVTASSSYAITAYSLIANSNNTTSVTMGINPAGSINPTGSNNYIALYAPRVSTLTTSTGLNAASTDKTQMQVTIQYYDGLGRPVQTVQAKGSASGFDLVQPIGYDQFGRQATKYLPYSTQTGQYGSFRTDALNSGAGVSNFYNPAGSGVSGSQQSNGVVVNPSPYSQTIFEASPLNRITEQGAPGTPWQPIVNSTAGHTAKFVYTANNSTSFSTDSVNGMKVALYTATINANQSRTLVANNFYSANRLDVTVTKDENWISGRAGTVEEYKDKEGHVVLKRQYNFVNGKVQMLSTYYVYDDLGNLAFVLPPLVTAADSALSINQNKLDNLCYQYRYDQRNRLIQKKIPGKGWEFTVYNTLNQPVMAQDANQRNKTPQQWTFTKYDAQNRAILIGMYTSSGSTADTSIHNPDTSKWVTLRNLYKNTTNPKWENRNSTTLTGYDELSDPIGHSYTYYTISYYDNYSGIPGLPSNYTITSGVSVMTAGLPTAKKTAVLNSPTDQLWNVMYYDDLGRITQAFSQHYLGGIVDTGNYDRVTTTYNFPNQPTTVTRKHHSKVGGVNNPIITITNNYYYDHMGRKRSTWEQITNGTNTPTTKTLISKIDYNEVGQVLHKHLHSTDSLTFLQNIAYTYNERGWLLTSSAPLFEMDLYYNTLTNKAYNGNIMYQYWGTPGNMTKRWIYGYDKLNRVSSGSLLLIPSGTAAQSEQPTAYDLNGNITVLTRYDAGHNLIDNLTYTYNGTNQLQHIADGSGSNSGLWNGTTTYTYDNNGNMLTSNNPAPNNTQNKTITYNLLNLPQTATVSTSTGGSSTQTYTYDATGNKMRRKSTGTNNTTDYIAGIQYDGTTTPTLSFIQTDEGKAVPNGTGYDYTYYLGDNLGNTRITFDTKTGSALAQQSDDYYPFGMEINNNVVSPKNEYLYNKKELQEELAEYDYGARFYDPVIARWTTIDRYAEKYKSHSPYSYVLNNPLKAIDVNGDTLKITYNNQTYIYQNGKLYQNGSEYKGKVSGFLKDAVNALGKINSAKEGASMLSHLEGSKNNFTLAKGASHFQPTDALKAHAKEIQNDPSQADALQSLTDAGKDLSGGSGGTIFWDPSGKELPTTSGGQTNPTTDLAHEMFHGLDSDSGLLNDKLRDGIKTDEWQAVFRENILRGQLGEPLRTNYVISVDPSGAYVGGAGPSMLTPANTPIFPYPLNN